MAIEKPQKISNYNGQLGDQDPSRMATYLTDIDKDIKNITQHFAETAQIPSQTGHSGEFLTTDGTSLSWEPVSTDGTWTPTLTFGAGGVTGITYGVQSGFYTKIGSLVTCTGQITLTSKGTDTGGAKITGLPFTVSNNTGAYSPPSFWISAISFADFFMSLLTVGGTDFQLYESTNAGVTTAILDSNFANNSSIMFSVTYRVA